jgi:hypothetical protein
MLSDDLFDFWSVVSGAMKCHPRDEEILLRARHSFNLECLPASYIGKLKTAPVVLLYLSPGFREFDLEEAVTEAGQRRYEKQRTGLDPLPDRGDHEPVWRWWTSATSAFGIDRSLIRERVAILNIGAYHSRDFRDAPMLAALPSSRVSLEWAQSVLFPLAKDGERVVICLRSARWWGLADGETGERYGRALFVPRVNKAGFMSKKWPLREDILVAVREKLASSN